MARYIDADEFIKYEIERNGCVPFIDGGNYNVDRLDDEVNYFPSADVQKVRHGKWKEVYKNDIAIVYECTNCKHLTFGISDYCICGTKMDGKEDEE